MITYLDTSVLIKLLVQESGSGRARELWDSSAVVTAARTGYAEARAALAAGHRNGRIAPAVWTQTKVELERFWSEIHPIDLSEELIAEAGDVAESAALRGYDAVHLAAALRVSADVVASSDQELLRAARSYGLHTSDPTAN